MHLQINCGEHQLGFHVEAQQNILIHLEYMFHPFRNHQYQSGLEPMTFRVVCEHTNPWATVVLL